MSSYDKGKVDRQISVGDLVLGRIPGLGRKFEDAGRVHLCGKRFPVKSNTRSES